MRPTRTRLRLLVPSALLVAACGAGSQPGSAGGAPSGSPGSASATSQPAADDDLVVELDRGQGGEPERHRLTCADPVAGDLPGAAAACAHLRGLDAPFARVPADAICTQQYGGAQTARVIGRWAGDPVDLQLSRTDGCRISQWDRLGPLLPGPVG